MLIRVGRCRKNVYLFWGDSIFICDIRNEHSEKNEGIRLKNQPEAFYYMAHPSQIFFNNISALPNIFLRCFPLSIFYFGCGHRNHLLENSGYIFAGLVCDNHDYIILDGTPKFLNRSPHLEGHPGRQVEDSLETFGVAFYLGSGLGTHSTKRMFSVASYSERIVECPGGGTFFPEMAQSMAVSRVEKVTAGDEFEGSRQITPPPNLMGARSLGRRDEFEGK